MVERWHRSLKNAIRCHTSKDWVDTLPIVLLGLRVCIKEDINASTAEMLYGKSLRIPGEFFDDLKMPPSDPKFFVEPLRRFMQQFRSIPTAHHHKVKLFIFKDIYSCSHVFLRDDSVKKPLDAPYTGPFQVSRRITDRVFEIVIDGKNITVSVDRLKPAFMPSQHIQPTDVSFSNKPATSVNISKDTVLPNTNSDSNLNPNDNKLNHNFPQSTNLRTYPGPKNKNLVRFNNKISIKLITP